MKRAGQEFDSHRCNSKNIHLSHFSKWVQTMFSDKTDIFDRKIKN